MQTKKVQSYRLSHDTIKKIDEIVKSELLSSNVKLSKAQVIEFAINNLYKKANIKGDNCD